MELNIHHRPPDEYSKDLLVKDLIAFRPFTYRELFFKRIIDIVGGMVGSFLFLIVAVILFMPYLLSNEKDKGPMIYRQKRYGYHGEVFYILKFRTMIMNAEEYLNTHPEINKLYHDNGNKLERDPRVTKIGAFIRNKSIDELPQFINVLKGDMSLVGPRPILLFEAEEYGEKLPYLLACKPGITGYWTTHGRSKILFPERADLELHYLKIHGTFFDIIIILMTIVQSIRGESAF
ncbi:MAG: sugar transferase [Streptococcaceae bacterium]|nr:sugar transferase [Streptococcaceae bacterium]